MSSWTVVLNFSDTKVCRNRWYFFIIFFSWLCNSVESIRKVCASCLTEIQLTCIQYQNRLFLQCNQSHKCFSFYNLSQLYFKASCALRPTNSCCRGSAAMWTIIKSPFDMFIICIIIKTSTKRMKTCLSIFFVHVN